MNWRVILPLVAIAAFFVLVFCVQHLWFANQRLSTEMADIIVERDKAYENIESMKVKQKEAAEIDIRVTKELTDAEKKNDLLRTELTTATRKLRIKANCPAATTGSMGDDSSVELSNATGQSVLDIRAGIIRDRAKIDYLQNYITKVCLSQ